MPFVTEQDVESITDSRVLTAPYPQSFFKVQKDYNNGLPYVQTPKVPNGAFISTKDLEYLYIPITTMEIGPYSFIGSSIPTLQINALCNYDIKSFEDDCVITYYPTE